MHFRLATEVINSEIKNLDKHLNVIIKLKTA